MIPGFAKGQELNHGERDGEEQQHMNVTALMQQEFEDEPNDQKQSASNPHLREPFYRTFGLADAVNKREPAARFDGFTVWTTPPETKNRTGREKFAEP